MPAKLLCAAALGGVALIACASGGYELGPDEVILTKAQVAALEETEQRVDTLEQTLKALQAEKRALSERLDRAEVRVGLADFVPAGLKPRRGRVELVDAHVVTDPQSRARKRSLADELQARGRGMVVSYWATWCVPCISDEELEHLATLKTQLAMHGVRLVWMGVDDLDKIRNHPKAARWMYPLWHKDDGHLAMLPRDFIEGVGVNLPLFLLLNSAGELRYYRDNKLDAAAVREIVDAAIRLD